LTRVDDDVPFLNKLYVKQLGNRLKPLLGPVLDAILREDMRRSAARGKPGQRHLLPELLENAFRAADETERGKESRYGGDAAAFCNLVSVLERRSGDPGFSLMLPGLVDPANFRHDLIVLSFTDHILRSTPYQVALPTAPGQSRRSFDILLTAGDSPGLEIEVKAPQELEGPTKFVSEKAALFAIRKAWRKTVGPTKQLTGGRAGALLLGGVTMRPESLLTLQRAGICWLRNNALSHPNLWGLIFLTMITLEDDPVYSGQEDQRRKRVKLTSRVQMSACANPHYAGAVNLQFTRSVF
jgi:hypothetical protein